MCNISQDSFICPSIIQSGDEEIAKRCVPTQTQIRQQLGSKLSDVFFEFIGNEGKAYLGLEPPLAGPDMVWVSPNARLEGKVAVTSVPEPDVLHLKAFTHKNVLDVGELYIKKLENKHRIEMKEALESQADALEEECKKRLALADDGGSEEATGQTKKIVGTLMEHFDNCFNDLVKTTQLRMRKECQLKVEEERAAVAAAMLIQLQDEVERRDMELCNEFHDILSNELNVLATRYIKQINTERETATELIRETVKNYEKMMDDLRIELQLSNVVDICRAITQERLDCGVRIRQIENSLKSKQDDLIKFIEDLQTENCTLKKMATERLKRLMQWRKKIREILLEFQRFINFALKAVPGQAEFMLNMEKLMLKKYPEDSFLLPVILLNFAQEEYLHFKNCLKEKLSDEMEEIEIPIIEPPSEDSESKIIEEEGEAWSQLTPPYCRKSLIEPGEEPQMTFDYDMFKSKLKRDFGISEKRTNLRRKHRKPVCLWKKKKGVSLDKTNELYQMMTLAGENEKQHLSPVDCFLKRRLKTVHKICADEPEFATIILGCSNN